MLIWEGTHCKDRIAFLWDGIFFLITSVELLAYDTPEGSYRCDIITGNISINSPFSYFYLFVFFVLAY
jgi:hypothetical protein